MNNPYNSRWYLAYKIAQLCGGLGGERIDMTDEQYKELRFWIAANFMLTIIVICVMWFMLGSSLARIQVAISAPCTKVEQAK